MNTVHRIVFGAGRGDHPQLIPEILEIGWGSFAVADRGHLRPHAHAGAFEFCFILSGEVEWSTENSSDILRERDVYLTQPDEVHWGRDGAMHPCTLYWVILGSLDSGFTWPDLDPGLATQLDRQLHRTRTHRLRGTTRLQDAFSELFEEHTARSGTREQRALQEGNARAALHRLLIELVRTLERKADEAAAGPSCLPQPAARVIEILDRNAHDHDSIHRICRATGTTLRQLNEQFVEHLGATVAQYWLRQRVRLARARLLQSDLSVTEVATEFGFSSSQHFATVFRKITGLTPSQYRETAGSPSVRERRS